MISNYQNISASSLFFNRLKTPSVLALLFVFLFSVFTFKFWVNWSEGGHPFHMDVDQYYSYLIAQLIHHDLGFHFPHQYWLVETPTHLLVPKVTMGLAYLYLPFFVIADNIAYTFNYEGNGYSAPYAWCIHLGTIFYVIVGLWYCRKTLLLFFNEWVTATSVLLILFGTNLFYYTYKETEMSHSYLFFLFSLFIYHSIKWHQSGKNKHLYYFCFIAGMVTLIRPTEILILLFPLLFYVKNLEDLKNRGLKIKNLKWKIILAILIFMIPIIPQLIFWKTYTGQFLFFSYGSQEGFFFTDPKFYSVLFGWRKGWFIYTPLMLFSIIGLALLYLKKRELFFSIFIYFIINLYLICSWWDWGYGGAFGMRALVHCYAFLIIPFAYFINWLLLYFKNKALKIVIITIFITMASFLSYLNVFQTYLLKHAVMHWDSMTKEAYWYTFLNTEHIDRTYLETLFESPNYEEMRKGNRDE